MQTQTQQLRTETKPAAKMGFAIAGVPCSADTFTHAIIDFKPDEKQSLERLL